MAAGFPVGIQCHAVGGLIQYRDLFTAGGRRIPAGENIPFPSGNRQGYRCHIGVIALGTGIPKATVGVIFHIAECIGQCCAVCTVQIHIGFHHSAPQQTVQKIAARGTPLADGIQKIVALRSVEDSLDHGAFVVAQHSGTYIINEGNQRIKLILCQLQLIFDHESVHIRLKFGQLIQHQQMGLLRGNTLRGVTRPILLRAGGAKAHRPLTVIPERHGIKALHSLQHFNHFLADSHFGNCSGLCGSCQQHREYAQCQHRCQSNTQ